MTKTLVTETIKACAEIHNDRTAQDILTHLMTEVGELAQEVQIAEGKSYKEPGSDGTTGEAIDVIVCALDLLFYYNVINDDADLMHIIQPKLQKWKDTCND